MTAGGPTTGDWAAPSPTHGPSNQEVRNAAALILAAGLLATGVAIFGERLGVGADAARDTFGWQRGLLLVVGTIAIAIGALLAAFPRIPSRWVRWERIGPYLRNLGLCLLVLLGIGVLWTRFANLDGSFWHDEAFTVLNYSGVGPAAILFGDAAFDVNNHVGYNLLSWATAQVLGTSEAVYRLWSVVPALAALGIATWWTWRRIGAITAVAFAALAVAAPLHLELAPQARGYGLALLAATLMLIASDRLTRAYSTRMFLGFLGAALLGIWTLFIFAIAFVGQALALLRWPTLRRPAVAVIGAAGILSLAFYAPVLAGVAEARDTEGDTTISLGAALFLNRTLDWLVVPIITPFTAPAGWMSLAALALVGVAAVALWRRQEQGLVLLLVLPPLFFNLAFAITSLETAARHQFLLLTHVLILVAIGIVELGRLAARYQPLRPVALGTGVVVVVALLIATMERQHRESVPFEDFERAASISRGTGLTPIVTDSIRPQGLRYYLGGDLTQLWPTEIEELLCDRDQQVVYVRHLALPPEDWGFWAPASLDCALERPSVHIEVPQRREHATIDIWIVGPRPTREIIEDPEL